MLYSTAAHACESKSWMDFAVFVLILGFVAFVMYGLYRLLVGAF
jgi:flagellar biogenesis protein FliO